ncbi:hypothetical protein HAX54_053264 [Datura stramonium]|uniref:Uncharacterized protein n=1 Tax=Datura stramonium TaxID=4076 RepID=A0ABS8WTC2_DATST|nr:hypothetical protein [Datura stramonium]
MRHFLRSATEIMHSDGRNIADRIFRASCRRRFRRTSSVKCSIPLLSDPTSTTELRCARRGFTENALLESSDFGSSETMPAQLISFHHTLDGYVITQECEDRCPCRRNGFGPE